MLNRKIAMLGLWGVGKTSLVRRFVHTLYDGKYHSTIGVKVDKKQVSVDDADVNLMLWDIAGAEDKFDIPMNYVKGAAGFLLVMDGTWPQSVDKAVEIVQAVNGEVGAIPFVAVVNKADLPWEITMDDVRTRLATFDCPIMQSSAKTGENVEAAFESLTRLIL